MTKSYKIQRRTFAANVWPKGSKERHEYNDFALTSEYYPSKKWLLTGHTEDGTETTSLVFRTKAAADDFTKRFIR